MDSKDADAACAMCGWVPVLEGDVVIVSGSWYCSEWILLLVCFFDFALKKRFDRNVKAAGPFVVDSR